MKSRKMFGIVLSLVMALATVASCGGSGGGAATQYTLDVQGELNISPVAAAQAVAKLNQQQVLIGTTLVEVTSNTAEELGLEFVDFDLQTDPADTVDFQFILIPEVTSDGVVFKLCPLGNPYGTSYFNLNLAIRALNPGVTMLETGTNILIDEGQTLAIGGIIRAEAEAGDRTRIPVISEIPLINFLYQGEQHQAQAENLLILLTPQIIDDTEG